MRRLVALATLALVRVATADNQSEADKYFSEGRDLLINKKDPKGACEKFEKAITLDATAPGVMLNLGLCNEMQERYAMALYWFRKAQAAAAEANPPLVEYKDAAEQHQQLNAPKVAYGRLIDTDKYPGLTVTVDGRPVRPEEYNHLEVDAQSTVEAHAPGKQSFSQKVEVEGKTAKDITIVMKDEDVPPMVDPGKGRRRLAYIVGAGGVVVWGITLTYGLVVRNRYETTNDGHYEGSDGYDNAKHDLRVYGTGLFVVGTAAVGAAVVLYLTAPKAYRERREAFLPVVTPDQVGFGYTRAF